MSFRKTCESRRSETLAPLAQPVSISETMRICPGSLVRPSRVSVRRGRADKCSVIRRSRRGRNRSIQSMREMGAIVRANDSHAWLVSSEDCRPGSQSHEVSPRPWRYSACGPTRACSFRGGYFLVAIGCLLFDQKVTVSRARVDDVSVLLYRNETFSLDTSGVMCLHQTSLIVENIWPAVNPQPCLRAQAP